MCGSQCAVWQADAVAQKVTRERTCIASGVWKAIAMGTVAAQAALNTEKTSDVERLRSHQSGLLGAMVARRGVIRS